METVARKQLLFLLAAVVLLRLPFLYQAIQGDDVYYLAGAQHAQVDPLHPNRFHYVFEGNVVDMRGHSHPPLNAWVLGGLLAALGDIREVPFHAAYILFSLIAVASMWSLARRFSPQPFWATLLFIAVPPFVINATSLEADVPFLAFWMASIALWVAGRYGWAVLPMACAAMMALQGLFLIPILWVWLWLHDPRKYSAYALALTPLLTLIAWQIFERATTGAMPAAVLSGYLTEYGFQRLQLKFLNPGGLTVHALWLVFPPLLYWFRARDRFLLAWMALFFAGAIAAFFSGSARYLLPFAPALILCIDAPPRWLRIGFCAQLALALMLAWANYQHWDAYRAMAKTYPGRVMINADWGLRFYLESLGGIALERGTALRPGDVVITSELANAIPFTAGGGALTPLSKTEIHPTLPLSLISVSAAGGYSDITRGFWPFGIGFGPIDRVRVEQVREHKPTLSLLPMNAAASEQIVSGLHASEGTWRWTAASAVVLLKSPAEPTPLKATFTIHNLCPGRTLKLYLDNREVAAQTYPGPGTYTLQTAPLKPTGDTATVTLTVDKTFRAPNDNRDLGVILSEIGFGSAK